MRKISINDVDLDSPINRSKSHRDDEIDIYLGLKEPKGTRRQKTSNLEKDVPQTTRGRVKESNFGFASNSKTSDHSDSVDNRINSSMKGILNKTSAVSGLQNASKVSKQKTFSQKGSLLGKYDEKKQAEEE